MLWQEHENEEPFLSIKDAKQRQDLVKELHLLKTDIFMKMVESGMMPLRPGVQRLVGAAPVTRSPTCVSAYSTIPDQYSVPRQLHHGKGPVQKWCSDLCAELHCMVQGKPLQRASPWQCAAPQMSEQCPPLCECCWAQRWKPRCKCLLAT